jgi:hypothetical protein
MILLMIRHRVHASAKLSRRAPTKTPVLVFRSSYTVCKGQSFRCLSAAVLALLADLTRTPIVRFGRRRKIAYRFGRVLFDPVVLGDARNYFLYREKCLKLRRTAMKHLKAGQLTIKMIRSCRSTRACMRKAYSYQRAHEITPALRGVNKFPCTLI